MKTPYQIAIALAVGMVLALVVTPVLISLKPAAPVTPASQTGIRLLEFHDEPQEAPALTFYNQDNELMGLTRFKGKTVLVNFWATWCKPCIEEMPSLDRLQDMLGEDEFEVVAIAFDFKGQEQVLPFLAAQGIKNLKVYTDPASEAMRVMRLQGIPISILIDADGQEIARVNGSTEWDDPQILDQIKSHMK